MFRTVPLSIIISFSLYTQEWYMSYRFVVTACEQDQECSSVMILLTSVSKPV
jgi:hypothetical protein